MLIKFDDLDIQNVTCTVDCKCKEIEIKISQKETKVETKNHKKQVEEVKSNLSSSDLDNFFSDDSLWN